ncbi:MAG: glycoside hydrolase family 3 protein [Gammaproteobacteria bacterium]|nr:glycoside hydrolase family 3 protein [Gammaproteobacteria bacterium]
MSVRGSICAALLACACIASRAAAPAAPVIHPGSWPAAHSRGLVDERTEARISALLVQLSVAEKVGQVIQADVAHITPDDLRRYPLGSVLAGGGAGVNGNKRASAAQWLQMAREFRAVSLEGRPDHVPIPVMFGIDAVHGHNNVAGAVIYPHNIGLGAAHDAELVRRIGAATAEEMSVTGIDWDFAPALPVPQDPRWGRTYEGYSQDPALVSRYAAAAVEGLQGAAELDGKQQSGHVAATAKHYLGDGATQDGVDQGDSRVSEAELIRTHARGYVAAIDAGVLTVMASYSSWQGQKAHGNQALLTGVLKGRMGFEGFVVGDWNGHGQLPGCSNEHCAAAFNAGIDMFMAPDGWRALYGHTLEDVRSGAIPLSRLDDAVRRILRVKFRLGLFAAQRPYEGRAALFASAAHRALAREAVRKSLVLLKNDGVLPIRANARVLVTGPGADNIGMQCGGWTISWQGDDTSNADFPQGESIQAGLEAALAAGGGRLVDGHDLGGNDRPDVAVVVYGEKPYAEMFGDLQLALYNVGMTLEQLRKLRRQGIPVVTVFLSGRPLWARPELDSSNAFVAAWLPGTEGGGIADVLVADAAGRPRHDFSGSLSFEWPNGAVPVRGPLSAVPAAGKYPLGFGLSYAGSGYARPAGSTASPKSAAGAAATR